MYSLYKTLHPPTGVEQSVYCNFLNSKEGCLVTASANRLQVYRLNNDIDKIKQKLKFECIESFDLFGNISSIASCRYGNMTKDALIIGFMDAKLAIVEYDLNTRDLNTLSIHYFEDEIEEEGQHYNIFPPVVRVDPNMRCAVMLIYGCKLAVIPFTDDSAQQNEINSQKSSSHDVNDDEMQIDTHDPQQSQSQQQHQDPSSNNYCLSSYVVDLRKLDSWLTMRIIDIEFLFGYYEPTLFILCESSRTWVGRYAIKNDTCNSISLSLNLAQKTNPLIWPVDKLPSDCLKCLPVPPPIGGMLIFSVNGLIYINQSVPSYGVSLNSIAKTTSKYPFKNMEHMKITLDCSFASFLSPDRLLISLKNGDIYVVTLLTDSDSLRTVRGFNIKKGPGSVIPCCLTNCCDDYLFIGSRVGNSVLLKYTIKPPTATPAAVTMVVDEVLTSENADENKIEELVKPVSEVVKAEKIEDELDELDDILDTHHATMDPIHLQQQLNTNIVQYQFEICDILLNISPCGHSIIGESSNNDIVQNIDLVTTSGYSKNGAVSVLQRSIRPEILTTFELNGIIDMWSVYTCNSTNADTTYLFLSKEDSTSILQISNEISELEKNLFCTKEPSIHVCNIIATQHENVEPQPPPPHTTSYKYILQCTNTTLFIYDTDSVVFELNFNFIKQIKGCKISEPYIAIHTEDNVVHLYELIESQNRENKTFQLNLIQNNLSGQSIYCYSLFRDDSGLFETYTINSYLNSASEQSKNPLSAQDASVGGVMNVKKVKFEQIDEDELLYGSGSVETDEVNMNFDFGRKDSEVTTACDEQPNDHASVVIPSYWLLTITHDALYIYNLTKKAMGEDETQMIVTEMSLCFVMNKISLAPKLLVNSLIEQNKMDLDHQQQHQNPTVIARSSSLVNDSSLSGVNQQPNISEILMVALGSDKNKFYLVTLIDDETVIYSLYEHTKPHNSLESYQPNHLNVRFKRIQHNIITRERRKKRIQLKKSAQQQQQANDKQLKFTNRTRTVPNLREFTNIGGYTGIFINGLHPYFVFYCPRQGLCPHPYWQDGAISSFIQLRNASITLSGFIYLNKKNDIRLCTLPVDDGNGKIPVYYDAPWVLRKVQLRQMVHFLIYHEESKTYACVTSTQENTNQLMQLGGEDKEVELLERDENFILPQRDVFQIQLYTADTWEVLPLGKFALNDWEHVTSFKLVSLPYEGHTSGFRAYLAVSTSYSYNEEVNARGRIILFDIIETVPEPGQPLTKTKMKTIFDKEQKGPVTCLESVDGNLIGAVGQKVFLWEYKNGELIGRAFLDTNFYIHKMVALKNFILIADIHHSISLIRFQDEYKKLSYVAKDKRINEVYTCDYLIDNTNLAFLATDVEKNLLVYVYSSESHDNQGGTWLIRKSEFNIGSHVNTMFRLKCTVNEQSVDKRSNLAERRQVTYCTTLDGSIGLVIPITEKTFRRLFMLQNVLLYVIPHYAALNPKAYRAFRSQRKELMNPQKSVLDGDLLFKFFDLSLNERNDISKKIKTSVDQILDDLIEVYQLTQHF